MLLYIFKDQNNQHLFTKELGGQQMEQALLPPPGSLYKHSLFSGRVKDIHFNADALEAHAPSFGLAGGSDTVVAVITVDTSKKT